jgi:hypothetical protein
MNMQSGARHRATHSPVSKSPGHQSDKPEFAHLQTFAGPSDNTAPGGIPHPSHVDPQGIDSGWLARGMSPDPDADHFTAYGPLDPTANSAGYTPEAGLPHEESRLSALHVGLIAIILLAGFAIGMGRAWWIDEKLETASAKTPALAAAAAPSPVEEQTPSIQSSMDRAYIPPSLDYDRDAREVDNLAAPAVTPVPVGERVTPPLAASTTSDSSAKVNGESSPSEESEEPPMASTTTSKTQAASSHAEKPSATQGKKRKSARTGSSQKLASATKKERGREIDRVRTQAFSETSRDRAAQRKSGAPDATLGPQSQRRSPLRTSKVVQNSVTSSQYARCERIDHIIRREKCKWDLCNNKWGKGACPSFKHERPFLF